MNRLETLQLYPVRYRKLFYLGAPTIFIFFTLATLVSCFGLSFQQAQEYWHIPALVGGAFSWYACHNIIFCQANQAIVQDKNDIEADPEVLKEELEKAHRSIKHIVKYLAGTFFVVVILTPSFFREMGQLADLIGMCCFFAMGSYFRLILHIYSRISGVSDEEIGKRLAERTIFEFLGWASLGFFFLKTLALKGKMGEFWSRLPDFQLPIFLLITGLVVYLAGILGICFLIFKKQAEDRSSSLFNACIAFGTAFPLVWLYSYIHPYLFTDIPVWLIQIPGLILVMVNSAGIYFSFQSELHEKILGNSCLWFVRCGQQILTFIFFWAAAVLYVEMNPIAAAIFYGLVFAFGSLAAARAPVIATAALVIATIPFLLKIGEFPEKIEAQKARSEKIQRQPVVKAECNDFS